MASRFEIARGCLVSAVAAGGGGMLGTGLMLTNPFGGLSMFPFTFFGALAILLPTYLWFNDVRNASRHVCYTAVVVAGGLGGWLMLNTLTGFHALGVGLLGAVFGFSTALCWITTHHLTRRRSDFG